MDPNPPLQITLHTALGFRNSLHCNLLQSNVDSSKQKGRGANYPTVPARTRSKLRFLSLEKVTTKCLKHIWEGFRAEGMLLLFRLDLEREGGKG